MVGGHTVRQTGMQVDRQTDRPIGCQLGRQQEKDILAGGGGEVVDGQVGREPSKQADKHVRQVGMFCSGLSLETLHHNSIISFVFVGGGYKTVA